MHGLLKGVALVALSAVVAAAGQAPAPDRKSFAGKTITHVGMVVRDVQKTARAYADVFGLDMPGISDVKPAGFPKDYQGDRKAYTRVANMRFDNITLELVQPMGGPSPWREFIEKHGEGLHHIAFDVNGVEEQVRLLESKGAKRVVGTVGGSGALVDLMPQLAINIELNDSPHPHTQAQPSTHGLKTFSRLNLIVADNDRLRDAYIDLFAVPVAPGREAHGVKFPKGYPAASDAANREIYVPFDNLWLHLISPLEGTGKSTWWDMLAAHEECIIFYVDDVDAAVRHLEGKGAKRTLGDEGAPYAYMNMQAQLATTVLVLKYRPPEPAR